MFEQGQAIALEIGDHRYLGVFDHEDESGHIVATHVHLVASTGMRDGEWWTTGAMDENGNYVAEPEYEYRGEATPFRFPVQMTIVSPWPHKLPMKSM